MVKCSTCGYEAEESYFCPNCGSKIIKKASSIQDKDININNNQLSDDELKTSANENKDTYDNIIDFDDKISGKFSGLLAKSKAMDFVLDKTASFRYKNISKSTSNSMDRKYFEKIEPVFLEVYDSIEDLFVKDIFLYERSMMGNSSNVVTIAASQVYTPTKDMPHDKAVEFYQDILNNIVSEINEEKEKGTFDEETFYKNKIKQSSLDKVSLLGISKSMKLFQQNKK